MTEFQIIPKLIDWRQRLDEYVGQTTLSYVDFGTFDCALFADGCFEAQTGQSFSGSFKGHYSTLEEGLKLLQEAGFANHMEFVASKLPEIHPAFVQIGDLAVVDFGSAGLTLTVVGGHRLHGPTPGQRGTLPLTAATRAFAVGRQPDL